MDGVPQSIDDVNIKSSVLELTRATASAESIESDTAVATEFLPSGEIDFTSALKPMLGMDPPSNESSLEYYEEITENGNWKSFTIEESSLPDASDFGEIYD